MASQTDIANRALTKIGETRVTSLDENSKAAETIGSMFDIVRDAELRDHVWHFAKERATLAAATIGPAFGFQNAYPLPTDCLRVIEIGDMRVYPRAGTQGLYSIEGRQILTNLPAPLNLRYCRRITDCSQFDALFVEVLASRIAMECAVPLSQSTAKKQEMAQEYAAWIGRAVHANAVERPSQAMGDDSWMQAHGGGSYRGDWRR